MRADAFAFVVVVFVAAGCATPEKHTPPPTLAPVVVTQVDVPAPATGPRTLFERLGGQGAITAVVDQFLQNVLKDDRINHRFVYADFGRLRGHLIDQICAATGGPCTYKGRSMKEVHVGQHIDDAAFAALVEDLVAALDQFKVPAQEKGELLSALAGMHNDIVEVAP